MNEPGARSATIGRDRSDARQIGRRGGNVILDVYVLDQRVGDLLEAALTGTGVSPAEYAVYSQLRGGALTPSEIGERLGLPRSTLSGYLAAMRRRGHTTRTGHETDGRSYRVALTREGRACLESCRPRFRRALDALNRQLEIDPARVREVLAAVDRAAENAEALLRARAARG